jgi:hypothetical protein
MYEYYFGWMYLQPKGRRRRNLRLNTLVAMMGNNRVICLLLHGGIKM